MARTQVQAELIATNAISGTIIADNAITATHIATNSISGVLVQDSGIVTTMIAANNVTAAKIVTNAIQTRHIADDQVTGDKLTNNITLAGTLTFGDGHTLGNDGDDNLVLTGSASENIIIDSADDIILDADGGDITFKDGGTTIAKFSNSSSDFVITSDVDDKDIIFKGQDSTSEITALTLDMSEAGKATFNAGIDAAPNADTVSVFGRTAIGFVSGLSDSAMISHYDRQSSSNYALLQNASGSTYINGTDVNLSIGGTRKVTVDSDGKVGIGHTTPGNTLQVGNTGHSGYAFATISDSYGAIIQVGESSTPTSQAALWVRNLKDGGTADELFRVNASGSVGVGCTDPANKFNVRVGTNLRFGLWGDGTHVCIQGANDANNAQTPIRWDATRYFFNGGPVGIGTQSNVDRTLTVSTAYGKTNTTVAYPFCIQSTDASAAARLSIHAKGATNADGRVWVLQCEEEGVANDGQLQLNPHGGRVFIASTDYDGTADKLIVGGGGIGLAPDGLVAAGSGYGPSNGAASSGTIQLYSSSTGNMTISTNYSAGDLVMNMQGTSTFTVSNRTNAYGTFTHNGTNGGMRYGAQNTSYYHFIQQGTAAVSYFGSASYASGGFHTYSDETLKKDVVTITSALDSVTKMNGVTFKWKDPAKRGSGATGKQFGVIAQNMLEVDSELPTLGVDPLAKEGDEDTDDKLYSMDYSRLSPFFIEAIKELKTKLEAAEARIKTLEDA